MLTTTGKSRPYPGVFEVSPNESEEFFLSGMIKVPIPVSFGSWRDWKIVSRWIRLKQKKSFPSFWSRRSRSFRLGWIRKEEVATLTNDFVFFFHHPS